MNSYTATNSGNDATGWENILFNSFYGNQSNNSSSQGLPQGAPQDQQLQNGYDYYSQHQAAQQQHQAQQQYCNPYYAAAMNIHRGYSLGMPYYGETYDLNGLGGQHAHAQLGGHSNGLGGQHSMGGSPDRLGYPINAGGATGNQEWNYGHSHIDEINAGIANAQHHPSSGGIDDGNKYDYSYDYSQGQQQQSGSNSLRASGGGNEASLGELDYCDLLLRGLDGNSSQQQQQASSIGTSNPTQALQNQLMWNAVGGNQAWSAGAPVAAAKPPTQSSSKSAMSGLDYFMNMNYSLPSSAAAAPPSSAAASKPRKYKSATPHQATSAPSAYLPHSNSSQPVHQIDPLLETMSLSIPSVSLSSLNGNEVIRHIRSKTDDVITRFLPCVDFLVNCQQELRQGLAAANKRKYVTSNGRSRSSTNLSPREFFQHYVAPLPRRFERKNDYLMAREHLIAAKLQLDHLVREAQDAVPQGCEHVKNTFLGGMRENESWGLRKWLSKHGGAGSICNDLEEVLRTVKALKKEEKTTIKLAELLRPIASQAHDRLKKDVPQAYQEQSSAHPYLPFFHRLEACLKQMANYDPEEDDVICLDSDEEEEQPVKLVQKKTEVTKFASSHPVKKRICKREREEELGELPSFKRGRSLDNYVSSSGGGESATNASVGGRKDNTAQQDVICLDDSSDEEDNNGNQSSSSYLLTLDGGLDSPSQSPFPSQAQRTVTSVRASDPSNAQHQQYSRPAGAWRCQHCTFLNDPNAPNCIMCNDEDSSNETDDLANFLGGGFMDDSNHDC